MDELTLFFGGDICGTLGVDIAVRVIPELLKAEKLDFIIVNGENAAKGSGIELEQAERLFAAGVDVITGGNHSMERFDLRAGFGQEPRILRPANYPLAPGSGIITVRKPQGTLTILNIQGRENMRPIDCPFQTADRLLAEQTDGIVMVVSCADTKQKKDARFFYFGGGFSCFFPSHTHTQTADERILTGGTGYISDAGMIGAFHSIIGSSIEAAVTRSLTLTPQTFDIPESGEAIFCGIIARVSLETKRTLSLKRIYKVIRHVR